MTEAPLVEIDGLWKGFRRDAARQQQSLTGELWRAFWGAKQREQEEHDEEMFWALRGVSASVKRGHALGIIGGNGAGKTTLLRVLMGEHMADRGTARLNGKVSGLIDMLAGFNPVLTGRENIYVRGGYLGFTRRELEAIEKDVIAFADIGDFIDSPMQTYSQGMKMRLGFAVTTAVEADIMVCDEILAVGDFMFQNKCMAKMNELRAQRATVLVSHSLEMIVQFADEAIVLNRGEVAFQGDPIDAVDAYRRLETAKARGDASDVVAAKPRRRVATAPAVTPSVVRLPVAEAADAPNQIIASPVEFMGGGNQLEMADGAVDPTTLPGSLRAVMGEFIYNRARIDQVSHHWSELPEGGARLTIDFYAPQPIKRLVVGIPTWTGIGTMVTGFGTQGRRIDDEVPAGARHRIELTIPKLRMNRGIYYPVVAIMDSTEYLYRWPMTQLDVMENTASFVWGVMTTHYEWRQKTLDEA